MSGEAIALDEAGQRLGLVAQAGGGGMSVLLDSDVPLSEFTPGKRLKITVVEPTKDIRHTLPVEVRYVEDGVIGLAFASLQS